MHNYSLLNIHYSFLVPGMQYNDDEACAGILPMNKNATNPYADEQNILNGMIAPINNEQVLQNVKPNEFLIYPNPVNTKTQLNIVYDIAEKESAICTILDVTGKIIMELQLAGGKRRVVTEIAEISEGIYYIKICNKRGTLYNQKLHVVR